jgi:hypothetical protein
MCSLNFGDRTFKLARIDIDSGSAGARELAITLYPCDAFTRFTVTVFAGNSDFSFIKKACHVILLSVFEC